MLADMSMEEKANATDEESDEAEPSEFYAALCIAYFGTWKARVAK